MHSSEFVALPEEWPVTDATSEPFATQAVPVLPFDRGQASQSASFLDDPSVSLPAILVLLKWISISDVDTAQTDIGGCSSEHNDVTTDAHNAPSIDTSVTSQFEPNLDDGSQSIDLAAYTSECGPHLGPEVHQESLMDDNTSYVPLLLADDADEFGWFLGDAVEGSLPPTKPKVRRGPYYAPAKQYLPPIPDDAEGYEACEPIGSIRATKKQTSVIILENILVDDPAFAHLPALLVDFLSQTDFEPDGGSEDEDCGDDDSDYNSDDGENGSRPSVPVELPPREVPQLPPPPSKPPVALMLWFSRQTSTDKRQYYSREHRNLIKSRQVATWFHEYLDRHPNTPWPLHRPTKDYFFHLKTWPAQAYVPDTLVRRTILSGSCRC